MKETIINLRNALRPIYGDRETEAIIRLIFHHLKGWSPTDIIIHEDDNLSDFTKSEISSIMHRLLNHEPIQYILGEARFHGLDFIVTPAVLIPRPETSELVDIICDRAADAPDLRVLDIATGSGCIAIAIARTLPFPHVTAIDNSETALKVARENAARLKAKVDFIHADIFKWSPAPASLDIIVSNPPYIDDSEKKDMDANVLDFEPASALFVPDDDPLLFYKRITDVALKALCPGGNLYFEINPLHAEELSRLVEGKGFSDVEIIKDSYGRDRFCIATLPNN